MRNIIDYIKDRNTTFSESGYYDLGKFDPTNKFTALMPLANSGEYYAPNKYYYKMEVDFNDEDNRKEIFVIDKSLTPQTKIEDGKEVLVVQYYKRDDIYISEDTSGLLQKGASWNMNAEAIPHAVTLSKREEVEYMKELKGFGRNTNTINGLIVELNRLMGVDKPDSRDRSTLQGAINYLNDVAIKIDTLTPGKFPVIDHYGRLNSGDVVTDEWIDIKFDPNVDAPRMIVTHEYNPIPVNNTQHDMNGNGDTVSWPIYEYDDMGHMVGSAIHTETLPYNFKTIKVTNTEDDAVNAPSITIKSEGQIADNTQDILTFSASNRWVKLDNDTEDTVKVGHLLSPFIGETKPNHLYGLTQNEDHTKDTNALGDLDKDNTFEVPCLQFDEAGHILEARTHTITLPELYNKFTVSAESDSVTDMNYIVGTITADNMNDTITLTPGNKWIHMAVSGIAEAGTKDTDTIKIAHEVTAFDDGEANKEYGLTADETISDANNSFEIPAFKFDEAGHIRGARTHKLTLPFGFTKFTSVLNSTDNKDKTEGTIAIITPDTMTDTLTLTEGNKWICIDGDAENDNFTFSHYVNVFNEGSAETDLDNKQTFTVQELVWDRAGHLTGSIKRTYTLQDGFKNLAISNSGNASVSTNAIAVSDTLIANNQVDTATIDAGNRWLTFVANGKKVSMYHASAGTASILKGDTTNQTPVFGSTFKVLSAGIDQAGHVSSLEEHTVQIPLPSLNNDVVGGTASVLTKLSLEDTTGAFSTEHKNVGELLITGYSVASNVESITETDSINSAFGKVQKALNILNSDNTTENSIDYKVKNAIDDLRTELQDNCDEEFKTFKLIQDQITDGSEETIVNRVKSLEEKSLPEYKDLEDEGVYLMKMVDGNPTWIKIESWNGGKY